MDHSSLVTLVWDEKHLKALLRLHQYPVRLIQVDPWQTWIEQRGGLERVLDHLRNNPLPPNQEQILGIILAHPDASARFYYSRLHISSSAYFFRLKELMRSLLLRLNTCEPEPVKGFAKSTFLTNLPFALTPLIGADKSLARVVAILQQPGARLLTLTGPGGVGKTRLGIAAGAALIEDFPDGVFFVPLETVNDPTLVATQVARSLNMGTTGTQSLFEAIKAYLRDRQTLLILDNFEQLVQGGQIVTDLLQAAGNLKVLVTSREALNLYGEIRFVVPELLRPAPDNLPPLEQLSQWPALDLFVQRVQARHPSFMVNQANLETIVRICHRLDGLPLAIELAAAQIRLLSSDQALPQLEYGLKALKDTSRDRPSRQKTLWDAIDWSYQLLTEPEKAIFRRLAVFGWEWGLEAAQVVCQMDNPSTGSGQAPSTGSGQAPSTALRHGYASQDTSSGQAPSTLPVVAPRPDVPAAPSGGQALFASLEELTDKNLLRYAGQGESGEARFQMLQPVREYAFEQLDIHAEAEQTQRRHARYFMEMVQSAEPAIDTPEQLRWVRRIKQERENLQIALQWMLDRQEIEMAFTLLGAGWRYYNMLNLWDETKSWMERALAQGAHLKSAARAKTLWGASWLETHYHDLAQQVMLAEQGLALAREIDDKLLIGLLLQNVADGFRRREQYDQALPLLEESLHLFRLLDNQGEIAWVLCHIASTALDRGERAHGIEVLHEGLAIFRAIGDQWAVASTLRQIGALALEDGDHKLAVEAATETLEIYRVIGAKQHTSETLYHLASLFWQQGDFEQVKALIEESLGISREIGDWLGIGRALNFQGRLALHRSDFATARELFEKARAVFRQIGDQAALADTLAELEHLALFEKSDLKD